MSAFQKIVSQIVLFFSPSRVKYFWSKEQKKESLGRKEGAFPRKCQFFVDHHDFQDFPGFQKHAHRKKVIGAYSSF